MYITATKAQLFDFIDAGSVTTPVYTTSLLTPTLANALAFNAAGEFVSFVLVDALTVTDLVSKLPSATKVTAIVNLAL